MGVREVVGYAAHTLLAVYWLWIVSSTAPQLRRGCRDRRLRARILLLKTAALALTAAVIGVVHYWATHWWHVAVSLPIAAAIGLLLHRAYRRIVAAPRHRLTFARRAGSLDLLARRRVGGPPAHQRTEAAAAAPRGFSPVQLAP